MRHSIHLLATVLAICCSPAVAVGNFPKRVPTERTSLPAPSPDDVRRVQVAADQLVEAILSSPDLAFKMPVLEAAFIDSPLWEAEVKKLVEREAWEVARMHFIHFYWKRVSKKDPEFMAQALRWVEESVHKDESWTNFGIVNEMIDRDE